MKLTCGACANAGAAEPLTPERVLCPLAQVPMLRGQQCGYAIADLQRERVRALNRAERLEWLLRAARRGQEMGDDIPADVPAPRAEAVWPLPLVVHRRGAARAAQEMRRDKET